MSESKRVPLQEKPLIFVDVETTGLDPQVQEIIEFAAVRDDTGESFETKIKPSRIETASEYALKLNGYNEEDWANAPTMAEILPHIVEFLEGVVIAGQNPRFDASFINAASKEHGIDLRVDYHVIDVATLTYEHLFPCGIESLSLKNVCEFLGVAPEPSVHRALNGALTAQRIYHILLRAGWLKRLLWKVKGVWRKRQRGANP